MLNFLFQGSANISRSISLGISPSSSYWPSAITSPIKQSITRVANQNQAFTALKNWTFFTSTPVSVAVSMSVVRGGSLSDRDSSSIPPSDVQRSISPSPVPKARTIINILLIGKLIWVLWCWKIVYLIGDGDCFPDLIDFSAMFLQSLESFLKEHLFLSSDLLVFWKRIPNMKKRRIWC